MKDVASLKVQSVESQEEISVEGPWIYHLVKKSFNNMKGSKLPSKIVKVHRLNRFSLILLGLL